MFIDNKLVTTRVEDEENLVNLVLNIASKKPILSPDIEPEAITPEVVAEDEFPTKALQGIVKPLHAGRNIGGKEVPIELKHAAGLLAQTDTIKNVAEVLGLNTNTVAQAKHGRSTYGKENEELKSRLEADLNKVRDKALDRLLTSLDLLDDEKIGKATAKDISVISSNMAKVIGGTLPKEAATNIQAQLIVYAPTQVTEQKFEVVEI